MMKNVVKGINLKLGNILIYLDLDVTVGTWGK